MHELPHAARLGALPAAVELVGVRLPRAVRGAVGAVRDARFEIANVDGRTGRRGAHRPRRPHRAADRRRARLAPRAGPGAGRPAARGARSRAAWRSTRTAAAPTSTSGSTARSCATATPGRCRLRPAARRRRLLRAAPPRQGAHARASPAGCGVDAVRYQGNWFPHRLRPAAEDGVFFAGDCGRALLPAVGRGDPHRVLLRHRLRARAARGARGRARRDEALERYGAFSAAHARPFALALRLQRLIPALPPRALTALLAVMGRERLCRRAFDWYLDQAPPAAAAPTRGDEAACRDFAGSSSSTLRPAARRFDPP